ncbi:calmodulin-binding receptor-like cytoplasmic kinase 2 isoform X1 [Triticum dicoccoides]|uniref:calmodulin-binding receptor-like cytoplasmic kinase 2 isoform X1 n=1 Tax=Triticum dicoccoides TaxID=85692 RepID=UPI00162B4C12|nr:calmodulin-binding receptor-like cytoplasmic kinase 2 isoform X1 [Triticum dicoccoides]
MESSAARRQPSTSSSSMSSQQVSGFSNYSRAASDGYPYPSGSPDTYRHRRQASSYSAPFSSQLSRSSTRSSSSSFKAAARGVAGVFGTCFVPRVRKAQSEQEPEVSQVSRGSRSGGYSQGSRSAGFHVSTDSAGTGKGKEGAGLTVADIFRATSNFSKKNMVREGASCSVFKGKLRDGSQVAVKRARKLNGQYLSAELSRELETLQKIEHQNLVRFLGFFEQRDETLVVVEYVDNGSLREHLDESRGTGLELAQRLNIAIDVAHAVTYLHEYAERAVIHRDIRSSNVLLTGALAAKVAGFGLARVAGDGEATHVTTQVVGTAGYVDPEYLGTLQLTDKSDVYSFGVLLVELVTGRPPIERRRGLEPRATTKWALQKFRGGDAVVAMDPRVRRSPASVAAVEGMLRLAEQCVMPARQDRPSMRRCNEALWTVRRDFHRRQEPRQDGTAGAAAAAAAGDRGSEWVSR